MMGNYNEPVEKFLARNIVGLIGIDRLLLKGGTLIALQTVCDMKATKFSVFPIVQVTIEVRNTPQTHRRS